MVRIPNTLGTFLEDYIFKGMVKIVRCTRLIGVREVCNWQTLLTIMLVVMI